MSAYIVGKNHILFLVAAAMSRAIVQGTMRWEKSGGHRCERNQTLACTDAVKAVEVANLLWRENIFSVGARYPDESSATLPGPLGGDFVVTLNDIASACFNSIDPVQVMKSCDCYEYQSCEHDGWETSEAKSFVDALRDRAACAVRGYDAAIWGAPELPKGRVSLSMMLAR